MAQTDLPAKAFDRLNQQKFTSVQRSEANVHPADIPFNAYLVKGNSKMIQVEHNQEFKLLLVNQQLGRQVRKLSMYLMTALFINPCSNNIAVLVTPDLQQDNAELIYDWVRKEVCCMSCLKELEFSKLQRRFVCWLLDHNIPMGELQ